MSRNSLKTSLMMAAFWVGVGSSHLGWAEGQGGGAESPAASMSLEERAFQERQRALARDRELLTLERMVKEERVKIADLDNKMAPPPPPPPPSVMKDSTSSFGGRGMDDVTSEMSFVGAHGDPKNLRGEVFFRGARFPVKKGDTLPGGWRVESVDVSRLLLKKGDRQLEIPMGMRKP